MNASVDILTWPVKTRVKAPVNGMPLPVLDGLPPRALASATPEAHTDPAAGILSQEVRVFLRHLSRRRTPGGSTLGELQVVQQRLKAAGLRPTGRARLHEAGRLLSELVEHELARLRSQAYISWRTPTDGEPDARIRTDFSAGNRELEAWSAMYYLYIRPDFDLSLQTFVKLVADRNRRTIQRRLERGVEALTAELHVAECMARETGSGSGWLGGSSGGAGFGSRTGRAWADAAMCYYLPNAESAS